MKTSRGSTVNVVTMVVKATILTKKSTNSPTILHISSYFKLKKTKLCFSNLKSTPDHSATKFVLFSQRNLYINVQEKFVFLTILCAMFWVPCKSNSLLKILLIFLIPLLINYVSFPLSQISQTLTWFLHVSSYVTGGNALMPLFCNTSNTVNGPQVKQQTEIRKTK